MCSEESWLRVWFPLGGGWAFQLPWPQWKIQEREAYFPGRNCCRRAGSVLKTRFFLSSIQITISNMSEFLMVGEGRRASTRPLYYMFWTIGLSWRGNQILWPFSAWFVGAADTVQSLLETVWHTHTVNTGLVSHIIVNLWWTLGRNIRFHRWFGGVGRALLVVALHWMVSSVMGFLSLHK